MEHVLVINISQIRTIVASVRCAKMLLAEDKAGRGHADGELSRSKGKGSVMQGFNREGGRREGLGGEYNLRV